MDGTIITPAFFVVAGITAFLFTGSIRRDVERSTIWFLWRSRSALAAAVTGALTFPTLTAPLEALGPESISDIAEQVVDAVVGISTSPRVQSPNNAQERSPSTDNE